MTVINKQRFLPELGKLLTFMVEEDRQTALAMYGRLFDDAEDEQQLMDLLVSPTRQAVVIARTYDARERKQRLEAIERGGEDQVPAFVLAIDKLYQQVAPQRGSEPEELPAEAEEAPLPVDQFSLFPDDAHPIDDSEYVPFQIEAEAVPLEEPVEELPLEPQALEAQELSEEEAEEPAAPQEPEDAPAEEADEPAAPEEPKAAPAEESAPIPQPVSIPQPAPAVPLPLELDKAAAQFSAADYDLDFLPETRRKPRVFLLILFLLLSIPLTVVGIALLLIPTVLALALAVLVIVAGSATLVAAFSGFPKLADILIVLGTAVIVLALGLLLLWLFVWFVGGAIGGLIRGMNDLRRKWCYVEVPV